MINGIKFICTSHLLMSMKKTVVAYFAQLLIIQKKICRFMQEGHPTSVSHVMAKRKYKERVTGHVFVLVPEDLRPQIGLATSVV